MVDVTSFTQIDLKISFSTCDIAYWDSALRQPRLFGQWKAAMRGSRQFKMIYVQPRTKQVLPNNSRSNPLVCYDDIPSHISEFRSFVRGRALCISVLDSVFESVYNSCSGGGGGKFANNCLLSLNSHAFSREPHPVHDLRQPSPYSPYLRKPPGQVWVGDVS